MYRLPQELGYHSIVVIFSSGQSEQPNKRRQQVSSKGAMSFHPNIETEEIFVGNLSWHVSEDDIVKVIGPDFTQIKIFEDRATGISKGFCCITFGSRVARCRAEEILSKTLISSCVPEVSRVTEDARLEFDSRFLSRKKRVYDEPDALGLAAPRSLNRSTIPNLFPLLCYTY